MAGETRNIDTAKALWLSWVLFRQLLECKVAAGALWRTCEEGTRVREAVDAAVVRWAWTVDVIVVLLVFYKCAYKRRAHE